MKERDGKKLKIREVKVGCEEDEKRNKRVMSEGRKEKSKADILTSGKVENRGEVKEINTCKLK